MTQRPDAIVLPDRSLLERLQRLLLNWFASSARDLPWRRTRDAYRILVSEVMLQQTQVDRVLPKYAEFLTVFPNLEALASAAPADVIRIWAGLGYNRRAVNLQRAARAVLEQYGGQFPRDVASLRKLPGIGPYTAGAIACFAFEQDVVFMDTNIRRVLRRVLVGPEDAASEPNERVLLLLAQAALPHGQSWSWNQALIELGALICIARTPACWRCPLHTHCRAYTARRNADERAFGAAETQPGEDTYDLSYPPARRVAERRARLHAGDAFAGSRRYFRGRIVTALRELPPGATLPLDQLGPRVKDGFIDQDMPWLQDLVADLVRDGLIEQVDRAVRLPTM